MKEMSLKCYEVNIHAIFLLLFCCLSENKYKLFEDQS